MKDLDRILQLIEIGQDAFAEAALMIRKQKAPETEPPKLVLIWSRREEE